MPAPNSHAPPPLAFTARTRTRWAVSFVRPVMDCEAVVPLRVMATQPAAGSLPDAGSPFGTADAVADV